MSRQVKSIFERYIPSYATNPFQLAYRLLTNANPAARSAFYMAVAGLALAPVDMLLSRSERKLYDSANEPGLPILLVCGPPRSGTSLIHQYLVNTLEVGFINNLTSLFPQSPVYANLLLQKWLVQRQGNYNAFYGKSTGLAGPNDGLYLWDRWLGPDRDRLSEDLMADAKQGIQDLFGALQALTGLATVNKVNRLIGSAERISPLLPTARFICVRRNPVMLAQSLLLAREFLRGSRDAAYGLHPGTAGTADPVEDVCLQVEFLNAQIDRQQHLLGADKFMVVEYSKFCQSPEHLLDRIHREWNIQISPRNGANPPASFSESNQVKLSKPEFDRLQQRLEDGTHRESTLD